MEKTFGSGALMWTWNGQYSSCRELTFREVSLVMSPPVLFRLRRRGRGVSEFVCLLQRGLGDLMVSVVTTFGTSAET